MADITEHDAMQKAIAGSASLLQFDPSKVGQFGVLPDDYSVVDLEQYQKAPARIRADHSFVDVRSLATYLNIFSGETTMICADYERGRVKCCVDGDHPDNPSHKTHSATFNAQRSDVLNAWLKVTGKGLTQVDFGLFLEERAVDVVNPDPADVMDMVMKFDATKKVTFKSSTRLSDGSRQFQYVEENDQRGGVTLPDHFIIMAPVYRGMEPQHIKFMVRYRITDGALRFQVEMHDKDTVMREAMDRCIDALKTDLKSDLPIFVTG